MVGQIGTAMDLPTLKNNNMEQIITTPIPMVMACPMGGKSLTASILLMRAMLMATPMAMV
jgi:hypothetical protein